MRQRLLIKKPLLPSMNQTQDVNHFILYPMHHHAPIVRNAHLKRSLNPSRVS